MDWRIDSESPADAKGLRVQLESQAAVLIRTRCAPVKEDVSGGLLNPKFTEDDETAEVRREMTAAIDAVCGIAEGIDRVHPGSKFLATFSDVLTVDGTRRVNLSIDQVPEAMPDQPTAPEAPVFTDEKPGAARVSEVGGGL